MKKILAMVMAALATAAFAADEITTVYQLNVSKGYLSINKGVDAKETLHGSAYDQKVATYDTNELNRLSVASGITTAGVFFARNLSSNCNAIVTATFELYPGASVMGRLLSTNVAIYASTNLVPGYTNAIGTAVDVESLILAQ